MNRRILGLLAVAAMGCSLSANAQLTSADNGAAATDTHGLMWANTVGTNLTWSSTGAAGNAQAWVAGLNASDDGGGPPRAGGAGGRRSWRKTRNQPPRQTVFLHLRGFSPSL